MTSLCTIAHLSDLHFGNHESALLQQLQDSLLQPPRPDFLLVTGDLSEHSWVGELNQAKAFVKKILDGLRGAGHLCRSLVIPGNHDVGYWKRHRQWQRVFPTTGDGDETGKCRRALLNPTDESCCEYYPDAGVVFLKFDSNLLWGNLLNYANGQVGRAQFNRVEEVLNRYARAYPEFKEARKIALIHHHVHYLPMTESDKLFLMKDAGLFWRRMIEWGVELILHGHKHYATHAIIRYQRPTDEGLREDREVMIVAAGTATSKDRPANQRNGYYKIECNAFKCKVHHVVAGDVGFIKAEQPLEFRSVPRFRIPGTDAAVDVAALESILVPEDADHDPVPYSRLTFEATIGRDLSYTQHVTFEGLRRADMTHLRVPIVVVGAPGRESEIDFRAFDGRGNPPQALHLERTLHPLNVDKVICRVSLPPLAGGERFCVRLEGRVPRLMYRENDYDAVGLARFSGGLEQFEYVLRSELELIEPCCFAMYRSGLRRLDFDFQRTPRQGGSPIFEFRPRFPNATALGLGLICFYRKLVEPAN